MDIDDIIKDIPKYAITHKGCPRCCGTRKIRMRCGNMEWEMECHYYGRSYRLRDRMLAALGMEME